MIDDLDIPFYLYTVYYTFGKTDASIPSEIVNSVSILNKDHTSHIKTRIYAFLFYDFLTGCVHTRQTLSEMAKSRILMKLGWVDQLMGKVDHTKYFWPGVTLVLVGAHPNFGVTKKN